MGQRTAFLIKRTYWDGRVNVRLVHHQWGIGRVMHHNFIKAFMELMTDRNYEKSLKDFMTVINHEDSLYLEQNFKKDNSRIPNVFDSKVIKRYFNKTHNNNGGMIIDIKEKQSDKQPYGTYLEHLKISFILGFEECDYDYDKHRHIGEKPFENLYTGEEYVKISCGGEYACPKFVEYWNAFVQHYEIEELAKSKIVEQVA